MFTHITADVKESDDDYESPNSNDEGEGSGGDYESAADAGVDSDNDYEPPPSEPPDDVQHHQICAAKHSNSEYIGNEHMTNTLSFHHFILCYITALLNLDRSKMTDNKLYKDLYGRRSIPVSTRSYETAFCDIF